MMNEGPLVPVNSDAMIFAVQGWACGETVRVAQHGLCPSHFLHTFPAVFFFLSVPTEHTSTFSPQNAQQQDKMQVYELHHAGKVTFGCRTCSLKAQPTGRKHKRFYAPFD